MGRTQHHVHYVGLREGCTCSLSRLAGWAPDLDGFTIQTRATLSWPSQSHSDEELCQGGSGPFPLTRPVSPGAEGTLRGCLPHGQEHSGLQQGTWCNYTLIKFKKLKVSASAAPDTFHVLSSWLPAGEHTSTDHFHHCWRIRWRPLYQNWLSKCAWQLDTGMRFCIHSTFVHWENFGIKGVRITHFGVSIHYSSLKYMCMCVHVYIHIRITVHITFFLKTFYVLICFLKHACHMTLDLMDFLNKLFPPLSFDICSHVLHL